MEKDLFGAEKWNGIEQIFYALNNCVKYAILRNYECLPEELYMTDHNDIDIVCEDYVDCSYILNAKKVFDETNRVHFTTNAGELKLFFDLRYIGDRYYCTNLEKELLKNRAYNEKGFFVVEKENYFYSLLYHALLHKPEFSADYKKRLINMNYELTIENCSTEKGLKILEEWLIKNRYIVLRPVDQSVFFNESNALNLSELIYRKKEDINFKEDSDRLKERNKILEVENYKLRSELDNMARSKSWKITKPIRDITTYIKNRRAKNRKLNNEKI